MGRVAAIVLVMGVAAMGAAVPSQANGSSLAGKKIYIDPGHGGTDGGACYYGICEKNVVLAVSLKLREMLQAEGASVRMSRTGDSTVSLSARASDANAWGADRFVSIHANACGNCGGHGTETYVYSTCCTAYQLATKVQSQEVSQLGTTNRGVKVASFSVLKNTNAPAILVETAFMDYPAENSLLNSATGQCKAALGILYGIEQHYGVSTHSAVSCSSPPPPPPPTFTVTMQSPSNGAWTANTVRVAATTNMESSLEWVRVLVDGVVVKWITAAPHEWTWDASSYADGVHTVKVEARNTAGALASDQAQVNVDHGSPGARMDRPSPGHAYVNDAEQDLTAVPGLPIVVVGPLTLVADAWDGGIGVDRVLLYVDDSLLAEDHDAPYEWLWDTGTSGPGTHTVRITAVDGVGNVGSVSRIVDVRV